MSCITTSLQSLTLRTVDLVSPSHPLIENEVQVSSCAWADLADVIQYHVAYGYVILTACATGMFEDDLSP